MKKQNLDKKWKEFCKRIRKDCGKNLPKSQTSGILKFKIK